MNVVIIPPDNRVGVDGKFRTVQLNFPHINAVRFDGVKGQIEHLEYEGQWPAPRDLTAEEFQAEFGAVLEAYAAAADDAPLRVQSDSTAGGVTLPEFDHGTANLKQLAARVKELEERLKNG
jgi:hypothetical protein